MSRRYFPILVGVLALLAVLALRVTDPVPVQQVRNWVFDTYQRLQPRDYQPAGVRIVDIDETALEAYGQWPWPRTVLADLVNRLNEAGAAAIVFDIVFAEPDRTAPDRLLATWQPYGLDAGTREALKTLPDPDTVFAEAIAKAPVVTGFAPTAAGQQAAGGDRSAPPRPAGFAYSGDSPAPYITTFPRATVNLRPLAEAATGNGSFGIINDPDSVVRRVPLIQTVDGTVYPSLSAEALRVAQGAGTHIVKTSTGSGERTFGETVGVTAMKIGRIVVPTTARGEVMLYDTGHVPERYISAATVLGDGATDAEVKAKLQGHIVLIGTSAPGLKDVRATPLSSAAPGVSAHAQALEQMINGTHLRRPDWASGLETLALVAVGGALIAILPFAGALWCAVVGGVAVVSGGVASWLAFDQLNWLFDPVFPALAGLVVYLPMTAMRFVQTEREKRFVRSAFQRYLSPSLVERLARKPESLRLGGENRELTLLFSDVRGFTSVAETMTPEELTQFMNEFLTPMTEAVLTRQGCVDKYMGDAIMAFWNAPTDVPDHQMAAARAALDMRARLIDLNTGWQAKFAGEGRDFPNIAIGVGLNTGVCCVGNLGSEQRFDYSALGDDVNLASRLEGQSKTYGVDIVVSETTRDACGDRLAFLELDLIRVKGRRAPVRIFALVGDGALWADPGFAAFAERHAEMIAAYRRQAWDAAEAACAACRATLAETPAWLPAGCALDGVYQVYQARIAALRADPPAADWDAVFTAETK